MYFSILKLLVPFIDVIIPNKSKNYFIPSLSHPHTGMCAKIKTESHTFYDKVAGHKRLLTLPYTRIDRYSMLKKTFGILSQSFLAFLKKSKFSSNFLTCFC